MLRLLVAGFVAALLPLALARGGPFENQESEGAEAREESQGRTRPGRGGSGRTVGRLFEDDRLPLFAGCGDYALRIVSQPAHQSPLRKAQCQVEKDRWGHLAVTVQVSCDPSNRHDKSTVRVATIDGDTIGYLAHDDGQVYYPLVSAAENAGRTIQCRAIFHGGNRDKPNIVAWLDLKRPRNLKALVPGPKR